MKLIDIPFASRFCKDVKSLLWDLYLKLSGEKNETLEELKSFIAIISSLSRSARSVEVVERLVSKNLLTSKSALLIYWSFVKDTNDLFDCIPRKSYEATKLSNLTVFENTCLIVMNPGGRALLGRAPVNNLSVFFWISNLLVNLLARLE